MTITFPYAMPASPGPESVSFSPLETVAATQSPFSAAQQFTRWPGQLWRAHVVLPPIKDRATAEEWIAWMLAQRGGVGTFTMGQPLGTAPMGIATGSPVVDGAHSSGSETLATAGWTASKAGILKAGDLIQLGTGATARLHKVLATVASDSSGDATLDIWPRLRADYADGVTIVTSSPVGLFRLVANNGSAADWAVDNLGMYGLEFDCIEALTA